MSKHHTYVPFGLGINESAIIVTHLPATAAPAGATSVCADDDDIRDNL